MLNEIKNLFNKIGKIWNLKTIVDFLKNKYNSKVTNLKEKLTGLDNHTKKDFKFLRKILYLRPSGNRIITISNYPPPPTNSSLMRNVGIRLSLTQVEN